MKFIYYYFFSMSLFYPEYLIPEVEFYLLWSINDNSWGYYGYNAELTKKQPTNKNIPNINYYWSGKYDYFKIVVGDYEGVFNKNNFPIYQKSTHTMIPYDNTKELFDNVINGVKITCQTDKYIVLTYNDSIQFKLNKVDLDYVGNIDSYTKQFNELVKENYIQGIISRRVILADSRGDY